MMLLAKVMLEAASRCSRYEKASARIEASGRAIINPANSGFFPASHELKAIAIAATPTLRANIHIAFNDDAVFRHHENAPLASQVLFLARHDHHAEYRHHGHAV